MVGEADLLERVDQCKAEYDTIVADGARRQRELEGYYLRQESHIRQRVALIDEIQSCLTEERRCLEKQHQECRLQISGSRRTAAALAAESSELGTSVQAVAASLLEEEKALDETLAMLTRMIEEEDKELHGLLDRRDTLEREGRALEVRERHQRQEEEDMDKALRELDGLAAEIEQRKNSLLKKNENIAEWNRSLEARERDLANCQDQLREDLRQLENDESLHGIGQAGSGATVIPVVSQRELMDNHGMSIDRESDREELDFEDDEA